MCGQCERTSEGRSDWHSTLRVDVIVIVLNVRGFQSCNLCPSRESYELRIFFVFFVRLSRIQFSSGSRPSGINDALTINASPRGFFAVTFHCGWRLPVIEAQIARLPTRSLARLFAHLLARPFARPPAYLLAHELGDDRVDGAIEQAD